MTIAIPLNKQQTLYHANPYTAPKFAIYEISGESANVTYTFKSVVNNPWLGVKCDDFAPEQIACDCDSECKTDMQHISEHYALLDAIGGCSYLLADRYCDNMLRALNNGGVKIFKIPSVIQNIDNAIKNFLVGAELADTFQHIHHAS